MIPDELTIAPGGHFRGEVQVPGDKSITHRAIMLASIAEGRSQLSHCLTGHDCLATLNAMQACGVDIEREGTHITVHGRGLCGLTAPTQPLDCGNSGTSIRLLAGLFSGQPFTTELQGDASLSRRPMQRIIDPLTQMGAVIASHDGKPPLTIQGNTELRGIEYTLPVASAQVKSACLLAGLSAQGDTIIHQPQLSRDHTERMLRTFGVDIRSDQLSVTLKAKQTLQATDLMIPGDISSAAFFMVAASIADESECTLTNVGVNPTRDGIVHLLQRMGADITLLNARQVGEEPVADIHIRSASLQGIDVDPQWVANAIDEFPILMIAAACSEGTTTIRGAKELRVKESDRIQAMIDGLQICGIACEAHDDGAMIHGGTLTGGEIVSHGDHRIAMAFAIAALRAQAPIIIRDCANIATSFPNFTSLARLCGLRC